MTIFIISTMYSIIEVLFIILPVLIAVAFVTVAERKTMASMQRRLGPNIVGWFGLLQAFADALKLILKEYVSPTQANLILFFLGPIITLIFSLLGYAVIPFGPGLSISDMNLGILYMLAVSSLATYGILLAGWSANSKYAFLGSLRSTAQLISYELILSSAILLIILFTGSLNITVIIEAQKAIWFIVPLFPVFIIFLIGSLAETNRAPMDLAEAESELVSGFMTEHAASIFVFFFLAEYASILLMSILISILFLGGYIYPFLPYNMLSWLSLEIEIMTIDQPWNFSLIDLLDNIKENPLLIGFIYGLTLGIKTCFIVFTFIWVRASFPRIRYDQLMTFCWTVLLPLLFAFIILVPCILYSFDSVPTNISLLLFPAIAAKNKSKALFPPKPHSFNSLSVEGNIFWLNGKIFVQFISWVKSKLTLDGFISFIILFVVVYIFRDYIFSYLGREQYFNVLIGGLLIKLVYSLVAVLLDKLFVGKKDTGFTASLRPKLSIKGFIISFVLITFLFVFNNYNLNLRLILSFLACIPLIIQELVEFLSFMHKQPIGNFDHSVKGVNQAYIGISKMENAGESSSNKAGGSSHTGLSPIEDSYSEMTQRLYELLRHNPNVRCLSFYQIVYGDRTSDYYNYSLLTHDNKYIPIYGLNSGLDFNKYITNLVHQNIYDQTKVKDGSHIERNYVEPNLYHLTIMAKLNVNPTGLVNDSQTVGSSSNQGPLTPIRPPRPPVPLYPWIRENPGINQAVVQDNQVQVSSGKPSISQTGVSSSNQTGGSSNSQTGASSGNKIE